MSFIPHTAAETRQMLDSLGLQSLAELFAEIPANLQENLAFNLPAAVSEMELAHEMQLRSQQDSYKLGFIGAGAYEHYIPSAIPALLSRGEFLTAYTPYQPEVSQGNLQLLYDFQTMIANLTAMEVANASLYDGASALAEAVLMAVRCHKKSFKRILLAGTLHPNYRETVQTIVSQQGIELIELGWDRRTGQIDLAALEQINADFSAIVIQQPNFFGCIEEVHRITDWAHARAALVVAMVNPTALTVLAPPGEWGQTGADIVCGEAQALGIPLASGGPYLGFFSCRKDFIRQMPGRIVGKTQDQAGRVGYVLTLQAREQYIRRAKATSNICTNQSLLALAVAVYLSLLGNAGLTQVARASHANLNYLIAGLQKIAGVELLFAPPFFHEVAIKLPRPAAEVLAKMAELGIEAGFNLAILGPEFANCILSCTTETKRSADLDLFLSTLAKVLED